MGLEAFCVEKSIWGEQKFFEFSSIENHKRVGKVNWQNGKNKGN
jgi:hypothetical protein